MEVILLEKVAKLGELGDKVNVKAGFGRNFLIPYGKALPATANNVANFEERRVELQAAADALFAEAQQRAEQLVDFSVTIEANAGEEGKLFGSIGTRDIADAVSAKGHAVKKSEVTLPMGVIREVGTYDVSLRLHSDLSIIVQVVVEAEA
ncbi:50S ribosomal protein L9 [Pseudomonadales bacterium]|nr:50S ribosomal protein L9 [Pseudomonadales bacterium]MDB4542424.1 50S ribosomal protein L9 [Pseudomonadales bacterium]